MTNEFDLTDEQLAEVTGGGFHLNLTKISAAARNSFSQSSTINANTGLLVLGGGKNSTAEGEVQGATINGGNTALGINSISI